MSFIYDAVDYRDATTDSESTYVFPNARPIQSIDCPAFERHHIWVLCAAESPT
jgi:hypothetical protein